MSNLNRIFHVFSWIVIVLANLLFVLLIFWFWYPYNVIEFKEPKFKVVSKNVKQGGTLQFISSYCKHMNISGTVSRAYINGIIYTTLPVITNRETGCHTVKVQLILPDELPKGKYHLHNLYQYKVNPIRTVTVTQETEDFIVE